MLLMLQSSNRENRESLKLFKDWGNVRGFFPAEYDFQAHRVALDQAPNLAYGGRESLFCVIRDFWAMRYG